jgi:Rad3-related DNA helicase
MRNDLLMDIPWVYCGEAGRQQPIRSVGTIRTQGTISFKPVKVDRFGQKRIWDKDKRFLLMSATIVSPTQLLGDLGWTGGYKYVSVESQFHPRNRQVVVMPTADMTRKGLTEDGYRQLGKKVKHLLNEHDGDQVLIHSVSYKFAEWLQGVCKTERRDVFSYGMAVQRSDALAQFRRTPGSALIAPSADRGVDLPGDACRAQIIIKVPYLSLGDKQVSARLHTPGGAVWYNVEVARTIIQMVGRGVRSKDDWCTCYVLDSNFVTWYRAWGHLFPAWFRKGIRFENV